MSPEVALLSETWEIVKGQIARKEQIHVADALVRSFEEHLGIEDVQDHLNEFDRVMRAAIVSYFDLADTEKDWDDE